MLVLETLKDGSKVITATVNNVVGEKVIRQSIVCPAVYEEVEKLLKDLDYYSELAKQRDECRHYLMGVQPSELTVEDALESLGYGRNGLGA